MIFRGICRLPLVLADLAIAIKYQETLNNQKEKVYSCQGKIEEKAEIIQAETERAGRFILATNVLDREQISTEEMLHEYKAQQSQ